MAGKVTEHADGSVTIQLAARSKQLMGIAKTFDEHVDALVGGKLHDAPIGEATARKLKGYCEQLRIIADELKATGK